MINRNSNSFHPFLVWQIAKSDAGVLDSRLYFFNVIPKLNSPSTPADTSPTLSTKERALESRPLPSPPHTHHSPHPHPKDRGLDSMTGQSQSSRVKSNRLRAPLHTPLIRSRAPKLPVSELCFSTASGIDRGAGGWGASGRCLFHKRRLL